MSQTIAKKPPTGAALGVLALGALGMLGAALYTGLHQGAGLAVWLSWLITGVVYLVAAGGIAWAVTLVAKG